MHDHPFTELLLIRHGESEGNVAAAEAARQGAERIDVEGPDARIPLTATGERQAAAVGEWISANARSEVVPTVWSSSYVRARQTIEIALRTAGISTEIRADERLRDRELGQLDQLTLRGVEAAYPEEAARRRWLGKFYHRPPGGESWADVALRVRSFLSDRDARPGQGSLMIATHDAVVMTFIYVCTGMTDEEILDFAHEHTVDNASVTRLVRKPGDELWTLDQFSEVDHLRAVGAPLTQHSGERDVHPAG